MASRSPSRKVGAKKITSSKRPTTRSKKSAGFNIYCYRVASGMTLSFFEDRESAKTFARDHGLPESSIVRITVKNGKDLAKILQEHTV